MRILLLEDDAIDARFVQMAILGAFPQARVDHVTMAEAALDLMADNLARPYDFIFVDQHLPGQAGADFLRDAQSRGLRGRAIAVMMTGDLSERARSAALASDFDTFIAKPVQVNRLKDILSGRSVYWENRDIPQDLGLYRELRRQA